jgi:hypothetical protein
MLKHAHARASMHIRRDARLKQGSIGPKPRTLHGNTDHEESRVHPHIPHEGVFTIGHIVCQASIVQSIIIFTGSVQGMSSACISRRVWRRVFRRLWRRGFRRI